MGGPGGLRAALLASHQTSGPAGREGAGPAAEPSLALLLRLPVKFVVCDARRAGLRSTSHPALGGGGGEGGGGGGLDDDLSEGWGRARPSERGNIKRLGQLGHFIVIFVNH